MSWLKRGLLGLWGLYMGLAALSNLGDLMPTWRFHSGNLLLIRGMTDGWGLSDESAQVLLLGVIIWQAVSACYCLRALTQWPVRRAADRGLGMGMLLWVSFLVAAELLLRYNLEATHLGLFLSQGLTLLLIHALPD